MPVWRTDPSVRAPSVPAFLENGSTGHDNTKLIATRSTHQKPARDASAREKALADLRRRYDDFLEGVVSSDPEDFDDKYTAVNSVAYFVGNWR
ncbi:hypothetical protein HDU93_006053, partial [Gonapodya sp. JEL0774]